MNTFATMNKTPRYSVIDVETTGGKAGVGRITEIAIFVMEGKEVVDQLVTLINPEMSIPPYISRLTGITDDMVQQAPRFFEVARRIVEITENTIFVAHNATFDYQFIQKEFESLGYEYEREVLCTVKLSRKIVPGLPSYSLGKLCQSLGIPLSDRHRAGGDAHATALLLRFLMEQTGDFIYPQKASVFKHLHPDLDLNRLRELPQKPGVYFFYDANGQVIYVGKSRNIRKRVFSHLTANGKSKIRLKEQLAEVSCMVTGSELIALIMEADEIKKLKPAFNKALKSNNPAWGIYHYVDRKGYVRFFVDRIKGKTEKPMDAFTSKVKANNHLALWVQEYHLCRKLSGLEENSGACFSYHLKGCNGACLGIENPVEYNKRALGLLKRQNFPYSNFFIVDNGRHPDEKSFVWVERGTLKGYGWFGDDVVVTEPSMLENFLAGGDDNRDTRLIIRAWLAANKNDVQVIKY
ncbi:exonuclease domain-containing protein [Thermophagus sp. OGC60D27]|uniref:exonuclease domain-containing protein n=1 Tax=Thermophagus sp. OGC60D27 TaxID=3458415 RepID=UPI00403818A1